MCGDISGATDARKQRHQRGRGQLDKRRQFRPMSGEAAFQVANQLQVAPLVEIHDGDGGMKLSALRAWRTGWLGQPLDMESGDDGGGLGVVQAGYAIKDFTGVKGAFATDHEDGEALLL